jgi:hypothetical protein
LWLAALKLAGALDLGSKVDTGFAVVGGTLLGGVTFYLTTRALRSNEAAMLAERLPIPAGLRRALAG